MVTIPILVDVANPTTSDELPIETGAGTQKANLLNLFPRRNQVPELLFTNVSVPNDRLVVFDDTDDRMKGISLTGSLLIRQQALVTETDDFTLDPTLHDNRPVDCTTTFTLGVVNIDGNAANQVGATYEIRNWTTAGLTLTPLNGMVVFVNGVSVGTATIRQDTTAILTVRGTIKEVIVTGG